MFVIVPVIPSLVVGQWGDALQTFLYALGVLALLWFVASYGVPTLLAWAWQRTKSQLTLLLSVLARALPLLLLFSTFLFINAECWQVAGTLTGPVYVAVIGVFFVLGATFVLTRIPPLMRSLNTFGSWGEVAELTHDTPAAGVLDELHPDIAVDPHAERPSVRQRVNIGLLTVFSQAIQVTLVGIGLAAFFVLFGFLAIPEATAASWTGLDDIHVLLDVERRRAHARHHRPAAARGRLPRGVRGDVLHGAAVDRRRVPRGVRGRRRPAVAPSSGRAMRVPGREGHEGSGVTERVFERGHR